MEQFGNIVGSGKSVDRGRAARFYEGPRSPELTRLLATYKANCGDPRSMEELAVAVREAGSLEGLLASNPSKSPLKATKLPPAVEIAEEAFRQSIMSTMENQEELE